METTGTEAAKLQAQERVVTRGALNFIVDEIADLTGRHDGDFVRAAVELAIMQVTRSPDGGDPDPRRAVSVRAVATSLDIPYETCRRKVRELENLGRCLRASQARVYTAPGLLAGPAFEARCRGRWANLRRYIVDLRRVGFDFTAFSHMAAQAPARGLTFESVLSALMDGYLLRLIESRINQDDDIVDTSIATAMIIMNAEPLLRDAELAWRYAGATTPPPDSARQPVTIAELARRLGMRDDTVGRRVNHFIRKGWVDRVRGGYLFSMAYQQTPEVRQAGLASAQRFLQLVQAIRQLGVDPATVEA